MVSVAEPAGRLAVLVVTTGVAVATCTGAAAGAVGGDHGGQGATGGRGSGEIDGERIRRVGGNPAHDRSVAEDDRVVPRLSCRSRSR